MSSTAAAIAPAVTSAPVKANGPDGGGGAGEVGSMVGGGDVVRDVEGEGEGLGVWAAVTTASSVSVTAGPVGGVPVTLPTLVMLPAFRSAWVVV